MSVNRPAVNAVFAMLVYQGGRELCQSPMALHGCCSGMHEIARVGMPVCCLAAALRLLKGQVYSNCPKCSPCRRSLEQQRSSAQFHLFLRLKTQGFVQIWP